MDEAIPKPIEILQLEIVLKTYLLRNSLSKIEAPLLVPEKENLLIFNQQKMLSRLNGNVQLSKKIIQSAIKEMPKFIDHLFESIQEGNLIETKNIVHTMKGLIGQVGGEQLESSLNAFDDQLRNGESLNIQDVKLIDHSFKKLIDEVDRQGILDS
jgi:HPt (histidine-containing phosphotransfer) domain-containing protein